MYTANAVSEKTKFLSWALRTKKSDKQTFNPHKTNNHYAQIAQLVEQRTENPRVTGSIPVQGITRV